MPLFSDVSGVRISLCPGLPLKKKKKKTLSANKSIINASQAQTKMFFTCASKTNMFKPLSGLLCLTSGQMKSTN